MVDRAWWTQNLARVSVSPLVMLNGHNVDGSTRDIHLPECKLRLLVMIQCHLA
jgi:hypothetical protein